MFKSKARINASTKKQSTTSSSPTLKKQQSKQQKKKISTTTKKRLLTTSSSPSLPSALNTPSLQSKEQSLASNTAQKRGFAQRPPAGGPAGGGKKLSQAELIIQQHREKQKNIELEKIRAVQAAQAAGTATIPTPGQKSKPIPPKESSQQTTSTTQQHQSQSQSQSTSYEKPMQQPGKGFIRDQKLGKAHKLPPGMTIEDLNKMPPDVIAKTLNIDMGMIDALNDEREDEFEVQFSEDSGADATPPLPYRPDPGEEGVKYTAARIQGRHTVNMMPTVAPRPASFKGRLTIIRKLPQHFEKVHKNLRRVVSGLMRMQKLSHFDLAVTLVAAQGMQFINRQHRFVDSPTDVLAFTMEEPYCEGIPVELGNIADLGEIIISVPYVYAQAAVRHAMLRSMGHDLSDSKRPLNDIEKVKQLFQNVGQVEIGDDGNLIVKTIKKNAKIGDNSNNVIDIDGEALDDKLSGTLPPITLTSPQLDTLPPFDNDFIYSQVQEMLSPEQSAQNHIASMNRKARKAAEMLDSLQGQDLRLPGGNNHLHSTDFPTEKTHSSSSQSSSLNHNQSPSSSLSSTDGVISNHQTKQQHLQQGQQGPKWTLSQGFPPRDYFKYITESMVVDEMNIVLIHGFLHLCGYDHDTASRRDNMQNETDRVVSFLLKEGIISQRCADLASLYVLDDAPEYLSEESEDELLPAGLFMDPDVQPMTDEQIQKKLKEMDDGKKKVKSSSSSKQQSKQQASSSGARSTKREVEMDNDGDFEQSVQNAFHQTQSTSSSHSSSSSSSSATSHSKTGSQTDAAFTQGRSHESYTAKNKGSGPYADVITEGPKPTDIRSVKATQSQETRNSTYHSTNTAQMGSNTSKDIFKAKKTTGHSVSKANFSTSTRAFSSVVTKQM